MTQTIANAHEHAVVRQIAEYAEAIASRAGVGSSETAGVMVSFLWHRPSLMPEFMAGTLSTVEVGMLDHHNGLLSWHGQDGKIYEPDPSKARLAAPAIEPLPTRTFLESIPADGGTVKALQDRVRSWTLECFGDEIACDLLERMDRFTEEALELVQSLGYTPDRAHALVDYVFGREAGAPSQETGGTMTTLAALCNVAGIDIEAAFRAEVERITTPAMVMKIRAKQAAKPTGSALPVAPAPHTAAGAGPVGEAVAPLGYLKPENDYTLEPRFIYAKDRNEEWMSLVFTEPVYARPVEGPGEVERQRGWIYFNPDAGIEWAENHPVESGEVHDAEDIRPGTSGELLNELLPAWRDLAAETSKRETAEAALAETRAALKAQHDWHLAQEEAPDGVGGAEAYAESPLFSQTVAALTGDAQEADDERASLA